MRRWCFGFNRLRWVINPNLSIYLSDNPARARIAALSPPSPPSGPSRTGRQDDAKHTTALPHHPLTTHTLTQPADLPARLPACLPACWRPGKPAGKPSSGQVTHPCCPAHPENPHPSTTSTYHHSAQPARRVRFPPLQHGLPSRLGGVRARDGGGASRQSSSYHGSPGTIRTSPEQHPSVASPTFSSAFPSRQAAEQAGVDPAPRFRSSPGPSHGSMSLIARGLGAASASSSFSRPGYNRGNW